MKRFLSILLVVSMIFVMFSAQGFVSYGSTTNETDKTTQVYKIWEYGKSVKVSDIPYLPLGEKIEINSDIKEAISYLKFIPEESDIYVFTVSGNYSGNIKVTDSDNKSKAHYKLDGINSTEFICELEAETVYDIRSIINTTEESGLFSVYVNKLSEMTVDEQKGIWGSDETVSVYKIPEISSELVETVEINNSGERCYYKFTPTESGAYKYYSDSQNSIYGAIRNAEFKIVDECDNYETYYYYPELVGDFGIIYIFEAGKTYYLESYIGKGDTGTYNIGLEKVSKATDMDISYIGYREFGAEITFSAKFLPEDCEPEVVTWTSSNPEIIEIDKYGNALCKGVGAAVITATTSSGLSAEKEMVIEDCDEIKTSEEMGFTVLFDRNYRYKFVPEVTGVYSFSFDRDSWVSYMVASLNDAQLEKIVSIENNEDSFDCTLTAGNAYYLEIDTNSGDVMCGASVTVNLKEAIVEDTPTISLTPELSETIKPIMSLTGYKETAYVYDTYSLYFDAYNLTGLDEAEIILHYNPEVLRINTDEMILISEEREYFGYYKLIEEGKLKLIAGYDEQWAHWDADSIIGFNVVFDVIAEGDTNFDVELVKEEYLDETGSLEVITTGLIERTEYSEEVQKPVDYEYEVLEDGTASITKYNGWDKEESIVIPDTLDGYTVTSIGRFAFENNQDIKYVEIPDTVNIIQYEAFSDCRSLENILIPEGVNEIEASAFQNCISLKEIILPESLTKLWHMAFYNCEKLEKIELPEELEHLGGNAFNKTKYYLNESNWDNGALYVDNYLIYLKEDVSGCYSVKEGTTHIASNAMISNIKLIHIELPDTIKKIDNFVLMDGNKYIYYSGTEEERNQIRIGINNDGISNSIWHYEQNISEFVYGDVDDNGVIDAEDALLVLKYACKMITLDEIQKFAADTTYNSRLNAEDALEILKYSAGLIETF